MKKSAIIIRAFIYLALIAAFGVAVWAKIEYIVKNQAKEVISLYTEWDNNGKPVDIMQIKKVDMPVFVKASAKVVSAKRWEIYTTKNDRDKLKMGRPFYAMLGKRRIAGSVRSIGNYPDLTSGLYVSTLAPSEILPKGLTTIPVSIRSRLLKNVIRIPTDSIIIKDQKTYVWKVVDDIALRVAVKTAYSDGHNTVIKKGIAVDDVIIIHGMIALNYKDKIKVFKCTNCNNS